jgi:rfaE bifunctional protein kinase chain/domain
MSVPLTAELVEQVLSRAPGLTVGVVGDLFLDRYLEIDDSLSEPSLETGLPAYQVVRVRPSPGAAGTVLNNLVALGVGRAVPLAVIGDDGEGHELRQALAALGRVDPSLLLSWPGRRTPTYTKPMLFGPDGPLRELSRLDIKNRSPLPVDAEERVLAALVELAARADAVVVLDQVSEPDCGVVTTRVRERLAELTHVRPGLFVLADSRERIGLFRGVALKPNERECLRAVPEKAEVPEAVLELARRAGGPVFCTRGERPTLLAAGERTREVPTYPVAGPIDPVGAGDSTSAGIACAVAAGADLAAAAAFGNLVASITVQQIGTTGTATPDQVRERWREVGAREKASRP